MEDLYTFDEDRNFGIKGISKEVGMLKGKISEAVIQFGSMLVAFDKQQIEHFSKLMDAIRLFLNEIVPTTMVGTTQRYYLESEVGYEYGDLLQACCRGPCTSTKHHFFFCEILDASICSHNALIRM